MSICRAAILATSLILVVPHAAAQQREGAGAGRGIAHPDLSGTWVFNPAKSEPAAKLANRSETIAIACTNETLELHYSTNGRETTQAFVFDGAKHATQQNGVYTRAAWKGSELETEILALSGETTVIGLTAHWSVSRNGRVLKRVEDHPAKVVLVYDKQK